MRNQGKPISPIMVLSLGLLFSFQAFADRTSANPPYTASWPAAWFVCNHDADCALIESPCGFSVGVNIASQPEAYKALCAAVDCSGNCDASKKPADYVVCEANKCAAKYID